MNVKEKLESMALSSIGLDIAGAETYQPGATRFGGRPDVPPDFVWPTYEGRDHAHVLASRPLAFLAQLNCADLAPYDTAHRLPDHGLLSFFYELESQRWGYDPRDRGCARVYWFEDASKLAAADFPAELDPDFHFPMVKIKPSRQTTYPSWDDFSTVWPDAVYDDTFTAAWEALTGTDAEGPQSCSQLLGWPHVIQSTMFLECDLAAQGYYLGTPEGWAEIPPAIRKQSEETAHDRWMLLFQLDTVECGDFELMFGDCGHLYFYITKEDLKARRFDRIWPIPQCY